MLSYLLGQCALACITRREAVVPLALADLGQGKQVGYYTADTPLDALIDLDDCVWNLFSDRTRNKILDAIAENHEFIKFNWEPLEY